MTLFVWTLRFEFHSIISVEKSIEKSTYSLLVEKFKSSYFENKEKRINCSNFLKEPEKQPTSLLECDRMRVFFFLLFEKAQLIRLKI